MQKNQKNQSTSLKYGQTIRIHCTFSDHEKNQNTGLITSKSYTDPTLYYQKYKNFKCISNYRQSLFQVLPTASFDINDELNNTPENKRLTLQPRAKTEREQFEAIVVQKSGENICFGAHVIFKHLDSGYYINGSFECAKSGIGAFKITLSPQLSSRIVFKLLSYRTYEKQGDQISLKGPIQIFHEKTKCFLSFETQEIFLDKEFPKYQSKLRQNREYNDNYHSVRSSIKKATGRRYQLINENISRRVWRIEAHQDHEPEKSKQKISNHDLVYFRHTKDNKYLVPNEQFEVKLKKRNYEENIEDFFDGVWQIQQQNQQYQGFNNQSKAFNMNSSIRKRNTLLNTRNEEQKKNKLIARHLSSGRIFMADRNRKVPKIDHKEKSNVECQLQIDYSAKELQSNTLVNFVYYIKGQKMQYLDVAAAEKEREIQLGSDKQQFQQNSQQLTNAKIEPLITNYQTYFEFESLSLKTSMNQHGFRIYKFGDEYKKLLLVVLSSQELLSKFTQFLQIDNLRYLQENINFSMLNDLVNTLKYLVGFIYQCDYDKIKLIGNNPNTQRQKIFQELGMIQLITELLFHINVQDFSTVLNGRESEHTKIRNIYSLCYQILQSMAKNNKRIKLKISVYLEEYLAQMKKAENKIAYKSLQQVLDDNYLAIEKVVDENIIMGLIRSFNQIPDPQNLRFLSVLCLCKGRSIKQNQNHIFNYFYKVGVFTGTNNEILAHPHPDKFKFRQDHNRMQIESTLSINHNPRFRTLPQLEKDCKDLEEEQDQKQKQKNHWKYFIQYLNLLADLCVHRNTSPQYYVKDILPLKRLVAFLQEPVVKEKNLYQPFIRLVHYVYIQTEGFDEVSRLSKVKFWNQNNTAKQRNLEENLNTILQLIMEYIKKINFKFNLADKQKFLEHSESRFVISNTNEQISLDPTNIEQLRNVYTFLELLKSTLNLGFWNSINKLKEMVPCMLRILKYEYQYSIKEWKKYENKADRPEDQSHLSEAQFKKRVIYRCKTKLTLNKPEINLLVKCKILASEILDIIFDNQNNIRVSQITKLFKDILQMNLDLTEFDLSEATQREYQKKLRGYREYNEFKPDNEKQRIMLNETIWISKLKALLQTRDIFTYLPREQLNPTLILFEITHYRNQTLSNYCLSLLNRIYGQRKQILQNFRNIIIVSRGILLSLSELAPEARGLFLPLASFNILSIKNLKQQSIYGSIQKLWDNYDEQIQYKKIHSVIQQLAYLTMSMKKTTGEVSITEACKLYKYDKLFPYVEYPVGQSLEQDDGGIGQKTYSIINEKQQNNPLHQNLIKSQDHHLIFYDFIKIMEEPNEYLLPAKTLHAVYNFLTVLIWNNKQNKKELKHFLKIAQKHLQYNIGCIDFFREMYYNNKQLVQAEGEIPTIVDYIVGIANSLESNCYYKSKLIDFLRVLLIFDDKGYTKNQNIVMEVISRYQVSLNNKTVFISNAKYFSINKSDFKKLIEAYKEQYQLTLKSRERCLNVSPELMYISVFFQLFSALIENENKINLGKCTNMHEYKWLVEELLAEAGYCWPVIRYLRSYVNKLYYSENRQLESQLADAFIEKQFVNIKNELKGIVELKENFPDHLKIKIENPVRYTYLGSYVFLVLEQILFSLEHMFSKNEFQSHFKANYAQLKQPKEKVHYSLIQILEMLGYLMKRVDGRQINKFLSQIRDLTKKYVGYFPVEILTQYEKKNKAEIAKKIQQIGDYGADEVQFKKRYIFHEDKGFWRHLIDWYSFDKQERQRERVMGAILKRIEKQKDANKFGGGSQQNQKNKLKEYLVDVFSLGTIERKIKIKKAEIEKNITSQNIKKSVQQKSLQSHVPKNLITSKSKHFKLKNEPELPAEKENILINSRRKKLMKFIEVNKSFEEFKMEEFYQFCEQLSNIDEYSMQKYELIIIGSEDVIKSFVEMNQNNPNCIKTELKLIFLNLLTNFITRNNKSIYKKQTVDKWQTHQWLQYASEIRQAQIFLNKCNCAKLICSLIKNNLENSIEMANTLFLFGIAFLLGGNRSCQDSFMQIFIKDQRNLIFEQLEKLIKTSSENVSIEPKKTLKSQKRNKQKIPKLTTDTYDYFDQNESIMIRKFGYEQQTIQQQKLSNQMASALSRVYKFIQLLCEENNSKMKEYIRVQLNEDKKERINNFNFIQITNAQLRRLFKVIHNKIVHLPLPLINFLNEVTQIPCKQNQKALTKGTFFEDICYVSKQFNQQKTKAQRNITAEDEKTLLKIYNKSIDIALSCLEGNEEKIFEDLSQKIECGFFTNLIQKNLEIFGIGMEISHIKQFLIKEKKHAKEIEQILKIAAVVCKIQAWGKNQNFCKFFSKQLNDEMAELLALFKENLLCIEVRQDDKSIPQTIYFPAHPVFKYLSDSTKNTIMFEINRSTPRDKIIQLLKKDQQISNQIEYNFDLDHLRLGFVNVSISSQKIELIRQAAQLVSVIISVFIIVFAHVDFYPDDDLIQYSFDKKQQYGMTVLSLLQFILTCGYSLLWYKSRNVLAVQKYEQQMSEELVQAGKLEAIDKIKIFLKDNVIKKAFKLEIIKSIYCLFVYQAQFPSLILFFVSSWLGTFYKIEFFSLHLLDLVARIDLLTNVFQAVTKNISILLTVSVLGISFICIFSVFGFNSYVTSIYEQQLPTETCSGVFECILTLYISEEIGNDMDSFQPFRFAFDLLYVVFMDLLFGNIVSGIMIDKFAALREQKTEIEEDKKGFCFICNISRQTLQKESMPLHEHYQKQNHFLWNYVFYLYYVHQKKNQNIPPTGIQYIILEMIDKEDVAWIPMKSDDSADANSHLEKLTEQISKCKQVISKIEIPT